MSDFSGRSLNRLNRIIKNGAFWPDLELGELQEQYRIPSEYREETILHQLILATVEVNQQLADERCQWVRNGWERLQDVPDEEIGAIEALIPTRVILYKQAVYTFAKAKLMQHYASMNRRDRADHEGRDQDTVDGLFAMSERAVHLLRGQTTSIDVVLL